ncbi:MAG: HEPN domain-containing protein [Nitrospirae bacterium]|nr:HEPN domain-containing protein [Nitrospirota bacterium]MCL5977007.1 HEPN domain-containing protein [Nitrospirota bacterium]
MALTPEQKSLAVHRFQRAEDTLKEAKDELSRKNFRLAVNRAYYSVFYAMRAFLATVDKDSSKHSGVLSIFNQYFINTGIVSDVSVKAIQSLMDMRHEGDYQDFIEITEEEAKGSVEAAEMAIAVMRDAMKSLVEI